MFKSAAATIVAAIMLSSAAFADQPGKDWMPKPDVMKKMEGQGYSAIK